MRKTHRKIAACTCAAGIAINGYTAPSRSACPHPAIVENRFNPVAPNLIVLLNDGFEQFQTAHALSDKYHFKVLAIFRTVRSFSISDIDVTIVPMLQCEPSIKVLSFDIPVIAN